MNDDRLIFLFSQPRAGSTMLQSVLGGHSRIDTAPEPWIMFTPLYAIHRDSRETAFGHPGWRLAVEDFVDRLPGGREAYDRHIRDLALDLYDRAVTQPGNFFLDKTPRYALMVDDLVRLFPDAKYIALYRNPLAVLMSVLHTFPNAHTACIDHAADLQEIPRHLNDACARYGERICRVQYEQLVSDPGAEASRLCAYLGLDYEPSMLEYSRHRLPEGKVGDPTVNQHDRPTTDSLGKWKQRLASREQAELCATYLDQLGDATVQAMGYDSDELRRELAEAATGLRSEFTLGRRLRRYTSTITDLVRKHRRGPQAYHTNWAPTANPAPTARQPVTAIVVTHNEAHHLDACLKSLSWCDQIIVTDLGSTDGSTDLARRYTDDVHQHPHSPIVEPVRRWSAQFARNDWLLFFDPDERFPEALVEQVGDTIASDAQIGAIKLPWQFYFKGRPLKGTIWGGPNRAKRFFAHRERCELLSLNFCGARVREGYREARIEPAEENHVIHHWADSYRSLLTRHIRYARREGEAMYERGERFSAAMAVWRPLQALKQSMHPYEGWREGLRGLALSLIYAGFAAAAAWSLLSYQRRQRRSDATTTANEQAEQPDRRRAA